MKRLISLIVLLVFCFFSSWLYKIEKPVQRPDEYQEGSSEGSGEWWNATTLKNDADDWTLDPSIPANYVPVPGEDELYMVVDTNGKILKYRKRTKDIDGNWIWSDVNPDIPDNYEPVDGLENVYRVTDENGKVRYYKYIRNDDDTYAFVEVDEHGNEINKNTDASKIDGKHVHITGNVYERLDGNGVVIGYDKRVANADGSFSWIETDDPTADKSRLGELQSEWSLDQQSSLTDGTSPALDTSDMDAMANAMAQAASNMSAGGDTINITMPGDGGSAGEAYAPVIINNPDGTHTEQIVERETKNVDGSMVTYETYVKNTYDANGELIKTEQQGPVAVDSKLQLETEEKTPIKADIGKKDTIAEESARVTGNYTYDTDTAEKVFALLNAQRADKGITKLTASTELCQLAMLRAADMAKYDTTDAKLPTYGSIGTMMVQYKVTAKTPGENMWKTIERSADDIHARLQAVEASRKTRMGKKITEYGVAIVVQDGKMYFCEVMN